MKGKTKFIIALILVLVVSGFVGWRYFFVFGEGVKGGDLNLIEKKGIIFKTWEGHMIQEGFKTSTPGQMQSNDFQFSVDDAAVAAQLEKSSGKFVEVRYKQYRNALLWRGESEYVVTEVLQVRDAKPNEPVIQDK
jgi:hypothetical protein